VNASSWFRPYTGARVRVDFQCDPERLDELEAAMIEVMEDLQENGPDASYVDATKAKNREWWEDTQQNNGFWMAFANALEDGEDPEGMMDFPENSEAITPEDIQRLAKQLLLNDNRGTVVLLPMVEAD
jgi:predicted Zn-dependent peptidase